ncbi:Uncharacterised protein [Dorea longicatena]|nr:Uncharacterised protein [Dorea longicatena]
MIARGIRALVNKIEITLQRCVFPSPDNAPIVVSSTHIKASLKPTITRYPTAVAMAFGSWKKREAIVFGAKTNNIVINKPQIPTVNNEARYPFFTLSILPAP